MSLLGRWLRDWRPRTPPLPDVVARLLEDDDPDWFPREMAIAVAPPWAFWQFMLRNFSWLVGLFGRVEVTGELPEELRRGPLLERTGGIRVERGTQLARHANRARYRIAAAITRGLVPLRVQEPERPAFVDPTRPTTAVAAYPGGVVPEDVP